MKFIIDLRNNKDLLTMKIFGFSNFKIFFILASTSFILGWIILLIINPVTSEMSKYYEQIKSNYSRDIDHLVTFNNNGLWIKENLSTGSRIITANKYEGKKLEDITKNIDFSELCITSSAEVFYNEKADTNVQTTKAKGSKCPVCWKIKEEACTRETCPKHFE